MRGSCMPGRTFIRFLFVLLLVLGLVTFVSAAKTGQDEKGKSKQKDATTAIHPPVDPSQYVGAETCKSCHEDVAKGYDKGPHWKTTLDKHKGSEWQGCEACHGPGKAHAESADPDKIIRMGALGREESSKR